MNQAEEFVLKYWEQALETEKESGISALFVLAQAALETGWRLHPPGFNFFGIKSKSPDEKRQVLKTKEHHKTDQVKYDKIYKIEKKRDYYEYTVDAYFKAFNSPKDCFKEHLTLLTTKPRYSNAMKVANDPHKFATEIWKAGYATDVNYPKKMSSVINTVHNLLTKNGITIKF